MTGAEYQTSAIEQAAALNTESLRDNPYPGRGIVTGLNKAGDQAIQVYWVMGRSDNSRNRILVLEGDEVRTKAFDESKVKDPTLIIYTAMRSANGVHLVSNGDQTDSVAEFIQPGFAFKSFREGLLKRQYEPDAPNFTPRITGAYIPELSAPFVLSIIKKDEYSAKPVHDFSIYEPEKGIGQCIHTYRGDGDPLPSFDADPYPVILNGTPHEIAKTYWELLNPDNRVAIAVKGINIATGEESFSIINQLGQ